MACRYKELHYRLDDVEKLRLYAQSTTSKPHALEESLDKAKSWSKNWEQKAKEGSEKMKSVEEERDRAKEKAQVTRLAVVAVGNAKAWAEEDRARVQGTLAASEEAKCKAESKTARLEVERTSLLLQIRAVKDEVCFLQSQAVKNKEAMEEDYQKALEEIFSYGYGCCVFKHNICGDHPEVPKGVPDSSILLPLEFFADPRCPLVLAAIEDTTTEGHLSEVA